MPCCTAWGCDHRLQVDEGYSNRMNVFYIEQVFLQSQPVLYPADPVPHPSRTQTACQPESEVYVQLPVLLPTEINRRRRTP